MTCVTMAWLASLRKFFGGNRTPEARFTAGTGGAARDKAEAAERTIGTRTETSALLGGALRGQATGSQPAQPEPSPFEGSADRRFTALLFGVAQLRAAKAGPAEQRAIERIRELLSDDAEANLVPRLPIVLPRLISVVRRDDVGASELAERLSLDPTLVGEVVRLANSPRYRTSREITNLQDAVIVLGQRGLIQVVIGAALRPIFDAGHGRFSQIAGTRVWDFAQRCAMACASLCAHEADRFHAYLAGMVADIGMIVALRVLDDDYRDTQAPDTEEFHDALCDVVARLSGRIARQWDFHPKVCIAVERRAAGERARADSDLAPTLRAAARISKFHLLAPGLAGAALSGLSEPERLCYLELERAFGPNR
jgi:HD-like signal output (HDOD) protein